MKYTRECEETADRILQHVTAHWRDLTPEGIETLGEARRLLQRIAVVDHQAICRNCKGSGKVEYSRDGLCGRCDGSGRRPQSIDYSDNYPPEGEE